MRGSQGRRRLPVHLGLIALWATFGLPAARAGGPLVSSLRGQPAAWPAGQVVGYRIDPSPLGRFGHDEPAQWVRDGYRQWQDVEHVRLSLEDRGALASDVNGSNILSFLNNLPLGVISVIFDSDGKALDQLLGRGGGNAAQGFGGPSVTVDLLLNARINAAWAIINGKALAGYRPEYVRGIILHELGHTLGLAHSQINGSSAWDAVAGHDALAPCMSYYWGPNTTPHLTADDRAWITTLYPDSSWAAATGTIRGRILLSDGLTPVQGLNVIASLKGAERTSAVSVLSGYRYKADSGLGGRDPQLWGLYEIRGLPPGDYQVGVEPLADYPSMQPHVAIFPGARRFWHEGAGDDPTAATPITVAAGQVVSGKDIRLPGVVTAPETVAEVEPNDDADSAQSIGLQAIITGHADPTESGSLPQPLPGGGEDAIQDWYRFTLTEASLVTAILTSINPAADLNLYVLAPSATGGEPRAAARSIDPGTPPETVQVWLRPGDYFLGVSAPDTGGPASDYRLRLVTVAAPEQPAALGPAIQALLVGDVTATSARISWQTDQPANSTVLLGSYAPFPYLTAEFGAPELTRDHAITISDLLPGTLYYIAVNSRNADGALASPADVSWGPSRDLIISAFVTGSAALSSSPPQLTANLDVATDPARPQERLVVVTIFNTGGPAADVRLDEVTPVGNWSLAGNPTGPFKLGALGTRTAGEAIFYLSPTSNAAGAPSLRVRGSYARPDGSRGAFEL